MTSIIVSHDSGFLDRVCSDIIHYANRKLKVYKGNLTAFVAAVPEAQSYYKLEATEQEWRLPEPGFLEGVKSKDKAILKMHNVAFQYPGRDAPTFTGATLQVSLSSRVACVGPNGAGKSTLIKVLTGETEPTEGAVWKHPNLRIAYVAQHGGCGFWGMGRGLGLGGVGAAGGPPCHGLEAHRWWGPPTPCETKNPV